MSCPGYDSLMHIEQPPIVVVCRAVIIVVSLREWRKHTPPDSSNLYYCFGTVGIRDGQYCGGRQMIPVMSERRDSYRACKSRALLLLIL